jgi:hypothetical protein
MILFGMHVWVIKYFVISLLNKKRHFFVISLPFFFLLCVLLIKLHFTFSDQHSKNVLDLIHYDFWALLMLYLLQMIVFILFLLLVILVSHGFIP